jgi:hypothetical protein
LRQPVDDELFYLSWLDKYMIQKIKAADEMNEEDVAESPDDQLAGPD